jgi:anti-sigma B factor antagonist
MARHCTLLMTGEVIPCRQHAVERKRGTRLMLEIQTKQVQPDIVILEIKGRITLGGDSKQLEWAVDKLVTEARKKVILDLAGVTSIDSTGIGIIVMSAGKAKKAGGELRVGGASAHVEEVLRMTNIDQLVALHPSAEKAAAGF